MWSTFNVHVQPNATIPRIYFFGRKSKWDCGISLGCGCGHYSPFICHDLCLISVSQAMLCCKRIFSLLVYIFFSFHHIPSVGHTNYILFFMRAIGVFFHCVRIKNTPSADQFNEKRKTDTREKCYQIWTNKRMKIQIKENNSRRGARTK